MHIVFLGTASCYPTENRGVSCVALRHDDGNVWLFDCGEGSQIQVQKSRIKPGKVTKIFISHLHGDHVFGLPGLICTLSTQCATKDDFVLELFGPEGLRQYVRQSLMLTRSEISFKYMVHEMVPQEYQIPADWSTWKLEENKDGVSHPMELPGSRINAINNEWILIEPTKNKTGVIAGHNEHLRIPCFGFVVQEPDSPGKLDVDKLQTLGVPPGPLYAKLKKGQDVHAANGTLIKSNSVLGPVKNGRKVTIMGDTCNSDRMTGMAESSDVLIHEATLENGMLENALEKGHSTPEMAATFANSIKAKILILTHVSQRYQRSEKAADGPVVDILLQEAQSKLRELENKHCAVILAHDFLEVPVTRSVT